MKQRVYEVIEVAKEGDKSSKIFDYSILTLIILTAVAIVMESYEDINRIYSLEFRIFELVSIVIFTVEYLLRVWTSNLKYPQMSPAKARIRYVFSFMAIIDLLAILPFYLPFLLPFDLRFLRILRITRLLRVMKLNRYSKALRLIGRVLVDKREELISSVTIMFFIMLMSSTMIYYLEGEVQPDKFPNIIASFWWSVATLTTVGYGDVVPQLGASKVFAAIVSIAGIGLVALPTGIISSGFIAHIQKPEETVCPHCGEQIK